MVRIRSENDAYNGESSMPGSTRRSFNQTSVMSFLLAMGVAAVGDSAMAQQGTAPTGSKGSASTRRDVIKQKLPGAGDRDIILVEVTYPPGTGSPEHLHANGVMAFVVSGSIVSKVGDEPERTFQKGDAWWEPPGAVHRISRNASPTEPAILLAIYIAPVGAVGADLMKPM